MDDLVIAYEVCEYSNHCGCFNVVHYNKINVKNQLILNAEFKSNLQK